MAAAAQVIEMERGLKGQMDAAIAKIAGLGLVVDPNEKQDFADILFMATPIMKKAREEGAAVWCKKVESFSELLKAK